VQSFPYGVPAGSSMFAAFRDGRNDQFSLIPRQRGFTLALVRPDNYSLVEYRSFDTYGCTGCADEMASFLHNLTATRAGFYVLVATHDEASLRMTDNAISALQTVLGAQTTGVGWKQMYALISTVGATEPIAAEEDAQSGQNVEAEWWCALVRHTLEVRCEAGRSERFVARARVKPPTPRASAAFDFSL
jgi:hypothetical protein